MQLFVNFFKHENGSTARERERELQQVYLSSFFNIFFFSFFEKEIRQRKKKMKKKNWCKILIRCHFSSLSVLPGVQQPKVSCLRVLPVNLMPYF
jgi:hypothetical protein